MIRNGCSADGFLLLIIHAYLLLTALQKTAVLDAFRDFA